MLSTVAYPRHRISPVGSLIGTQILGQVFASSTEFHTFSVRRTYPELLGAALAVSSKLTDLGGDQRSLMWTSTILFHMIFILVLGDVGYALGRRYSRRKRRFLKL